MSRSPRLAAATVLGAASILVLATPFVGHAASAADSTISISLDAPADGLTITDASTITVRGTANSGVASLNHIGLTLYRGGAKVDEASPCCDSPKNGSVSFGPTVFTVSANGPYQVAATATGYILLGGIDPGPATATASVSLAVPPAAPTGVAASYTGGQVTVTWKAVPAYPDLMGYAVYRKIGPELFKPIAGLGSTVLSFTDTKPPATGGNVQYRVDALRQGAVYSNDPNQWLATESTPALVSIPVPPTTTVPGQPTTTAAPPGGGLQDHGAASTDLGSFFSNTAPEITLPAPSPPPTLPDTGYSQVLPYGPTSTAAGGKVNARQKGTPSASAGTGGLNENVPVDNSNRRALLVPIAAGSVLCVAALHLRWLNRRIAAVPVAAGAAASAAARGRKRRKGRKGAGNAPPADTALYDQYRPSSSTPAGKARTGTANGAAAVKPTKATSGVRVLGRRRPPVELPATEPGGARPGAEPGGRRGGPAGGRAVRRPVGAGARRSGPGD